MSDEERVTLQRWTRGGDRRLAGRARIVLACAEGLSNVAVTDRCAVSVATVSARRGRFARQRLAGLEDEPRAGRPRSDLVLTEEERAELVRWARRATTAQFLAMRARIVLACAEGIPNTQAAADLRVSVGAVNRWRARFVQSRTAGLLDEKRPAGRPRSCSTGSKTSWSRHWNRHPRTRRTGRGHRWPSVPG